MRTHSKRRSHAAQFLTVNSTRRNRSFQGYSWYDMRPRIVDTAVLVDDLPYEDWLPEGGRPDRIELDITISQNHLPERHIRLNALIHVDSEETIWNGPCF